MPDQIQSLQWHWSDASDNRHDDVGLSKKDRSTLSTLSHHLYIAVQWLRGPKSPSLVLDNWWNIGLTFDLSIWIKQGGPIQVIEQDEVHGDEVGHEMMIKF
jgi:hypothetical protein